MTVTQLSRVAGVSERTLRAAFHDLIGISPKQHMLRQRIQAAPALRAAAPGSATVTDLAMSYGCAFRSFAHSELSRSMYGPIPVELAALSRTEVWSTV